MSLSPRCPLSIPTAHESHFHLIRNYIKNRVMYHPTDIHHVKCHGPSLEVGNNYSTGRSFSSIAQSCLTLCNPMNHSTPGVPVHHQLPEFTQTHVHQVGDAIQPSHPLSSPSPPAPSPSQLTPIWYSILCLL